MNFRVPGTPDEPERLEATAAAPLAAVAAVQKAHPDLRVEEYKTIYDAAMARGGIYPRNLCMEEPPLTEENQVELVKHQINKMVSWGVFTPPKGWEPYDVKPEVAERIRRAGRS